MQKKDINPSVRDVYIWNIVGSMANALFSVVVLMLVTRSLNKGETDIFSIAWSISQLMLIIGTFQIRTYQATDIKGKYKFHQYLIFRFITILLMLVCSLLYIRIKGYEQQKAIAVFALCMMRAIEAISDVYEGWFQQKERLDLSGKAVFFRVLFATLVFGGVLFITRQLLMSCLALLLCYLATFLSYDLRYGRIVEGIRCKSNSKMGAKWIVSMFMEVLPIFVNAFLAMAITNAPKMAIDIAIEEGLLSDGIQTVFNILFMPASFINLAYIVFRPMITKMAIVWNCGREKELLSILLKIEGYLMVIGIFILMGSSALGIPLLSLFYGIDLTGYKKILLIIIVGGCFYTFASVFDNALVAMRRQYGLIVAYVITWLYIQFVAKELVKIYGITGATVAYTTAMLLFLVITIIIFIISFIKIRKRGVRVES